MQMLRIITRNLLIVQKKTNKKKPCDTKLMKLTDMDVNVCEPKKGNSKKKRRVTDSTRVKDRRHTVRPLNISVSFPAWKLHKKKDVRHSVF